MEPADSSDPVSDEWVGWELPSPADATPPSKTVEWVESKLGSSVTEAVPLVGGLSSSVHRLTLGDGRRVVLRRHTNSAWMAREPNVPFDEARILALLADLNFTNFTKPGQEDPDGSGEAIDTPTLIAADPGATHCDVPTVIMTEVSGEPVLDPSEPTRWAEQLADCLLAVHRTPVPEGLPVYRRWDHPEGPVPVWVEDRDRWIRARALVAGPLPEHEPTFLHRDFHPCNVHWEHAGICAVVDWLGACIGPAAADLAHCRWNLAILVSPEIADHFTDHYRSRSGYGHSTFEFDLATLLSAPVGPFPTHAWNALGRTDLDPDTVTARIEAWLVHVLGQRR